MLADVHSPMRHVMPIACLVLGTSVLGACGGGGGDAVTPPDAPIAIDSSGGSAMPVDDASSSLDGESSTTDAPGAGSTTEPGGQQEASGSQPPVETAQPTATDASLPGPVSGLRGVVYTDTEIEIFWQRTGGDAAVAGYSVMRDGQRLQTRDALSLYDDSVVPGTTYSYSVSAVSIDGRAGPASEIVLITPPAGPEISIENAEARLVYLLGLANREPLQDLRRIADETQRTGYDSVDAGEIGLTLRASGYDAERDGFFDGYDCLEGGELDMQRFQNSTGGGSGRFAACALPQLAGTSIIDGNYVWTLDIVKFYLNPGSEVSIDFDALTLTAQDLRRRRLDGRYVRGSGSASSSERWFGVRYTSDAFEGQTRMTIEQIDTFQGVVGGDEPEPWRQRWSANFDVQAPGTGNRPVTLTTQLPFEKEARNACFVRGTLTAIAVDGSQLTMDADNGDPDSVRLDVRIDGETVSRDLPWSNTIRIDGLLDAQRGDDSDAPTLAPSLANPSCLERS